MARVLYLLTFPLYGSGSGTYARELAREVALHSKVGLVCPDNRKIPGVRMYPLKMEFPVAYTGHPEWPDCKLFTQLENREIICLYENYLNSVVRAVEDFQPNIIHVHHAFPFSWAARIIKSIYEIPYIISVHGSELPTANKDRRYFAITSDVLRRAKRIIPNSFWTKEWLFDIYSDEFKKNVRVIPGGVNIDKFSDSVKTDHIDRKYGLKGDRVVVFAGKLTVYKGVKYLIYAAKKIKAKVLILGEGPERKNLEEKVKQLNLKNVHFIGHLGSSQELNEFYNRADVFVAPSIWDEPLGLVILEAMASKTPVVVTRKGGIPLAVKDGVNGFFVRPKDPKQIAEGVNKLLDNEQLRLKLGENARRIVEKNFSWAIIADKFMSMYEKFAYSTKRFVINRNGIR